jgi:transposase-like protein
MGKNDWAYRLERITKMAQEMIEKEFHPRHCKYCDSARVVRFGHTKHGHGQRLLCHDCGHTFMDSDAMPEMKTSAEQIASAVNTFYEGMSLNAIRRNLQQTYGNYPSDSTVYEWVTRYTKEAVKQAEQYHPKVGDTWVADETVLKVGGKNYWLIDIIDTDTRFLLDTVLSHNRNKADIRRMMETAQERAGKTPKEVFTDGWVGYLDGIESAYGADAKHIRVTPFGSKDDSSTLIERWHGTLKDRTKVMRGFKSKETAQLLLDGWLVHYNFFRPHESLDNKTPAETAGIKFPHRNWQDIVRQPRENVKAILATKAERKLILHHPPTPRQPRTRITKPTPRISHKPPKLRKNELYFGKGVVSRHYFRGAKRRRLG